MAKVMLTKEEFLRRQAEQEGECCKKGGPKFLWFLLVVGLVALGMSMFKKDEE